MQLLIEFENGVKKIYDVKQLIHINEDFKLLEEPAYFNQVKVDCGGYAIYWDELCDIPEVELWEGGQLL